jgi:hypothetical protein
LIELPKLAEHLYSLKDGDWTKLFDLLKELNSVKQYGELKGMNKLQQDQSILPYYVTVPVVDKFLKVVHELNIVPNFDWPAWKGGKEILNNKMQDFEELDVVSLCKLFTVIIRSDKFNEGFLINSFNDGTVQRIISALKSSVPSNR